MNNAANVSTGKPNKKGAIYVAPTGTTLPDDAVTALPAVWEGLGYISDGGMTNSAESDSQSINAWGGDTVLAVQTSYKESFKTKFIETNEKVLKEYWGNDSVAVEPDGISIMHTATDLPEHPWVAEVLMGTNRIKRIVIPSGKVTERGEIVYVDGEAIGYEMTITALPDKDGVTAYEYIAEIA